MDFFDVDGNVFEGKKIDIQKRRRERKREREREREKGRERERERKGERDSEMVMNGKLSSEK